VARNRCNWAILACLFAFVVLGLQDRAFAAPDQVILRFSNPAGQMETLLTLGPLDTTSPFFQSLGTNGRSCATCHVASDAWSIVPEHIQQRFASSKGTDPLFRPVDGSNCPDSPGASGSAIAASAYSLLLSKGLIRVSIPIPSNAQFTVQTIADPYGCAVTTDGTGQKSLSLYRRPTPGTNLKFLSAVMWDGRETVQPLNNSSTFQANLVTDLMHQALDATLGHAQASSAPPESVLRQIVAFELSTFSAQSVSRSAGDLNSAGALGGAQRISTQDYFPGINDSLGGNPTGAAFNPSSFTLFSSWVNLANSKSAAARESIARGEILFNTAPLTIRDVRGLNDDLNQTAIVGTCTTCHDTPNVGHHSLPVPLDIGISGVPSNDADPLGIALAQMNSPSLPIFQLSCSTSLGAPADVVLKTTDPGRAMITGRCSDIGKFKGPILRALTARAPFFQNGAADTLEQVVDFYNERFQMNLTAAQRTDLVAFLNSL
jgi:cytochrome c peroxidase